MARALRALRPRRRRGQARQGAGAGCRRDHRRPRGRRRPAGQGPGPRAGPDLAARPADARERRGLGAGQHRLAARGRRPRDRRRARADRRDGREDRDGRRARRRWTGCSRRWAPRPPSYPCWRARRAVLRAGEIARAPRVQRLQIGEADLRADVGVTPGADERELLYVRSHVVLASTAAGIAPPIAPVSTNFRDLDAFRASTEALARLGFVGRACIHPAQVAIANEVFTPTAEQVAARPRAGREVGAGRRRRRRRRPRPLRRRGRHPPGPPRARPSPLNLSGEINGQRSHHRQHQGHRLRALARAGPPRARGRRHRPHPGRRRRGGRASSASRPRTAAARSARSSTSPTPSPCRRSGTPRSRRSARVDLWVNNAGVAYTMRTIAETTPDEVATMVVDEHARHHQRRPGRRSAACPPDGGGQLFNILGGGSDGSVRPGMGVYSSTKRGLDMFTKALVKEVDGTDVRVGQVRPGILITDGWLREAATAPGVGPEPAQDGQHPQRPRRRRRAVPRRADARLAPRTATRSPG